MKLKSIELQITMTRRLLVDLEAAQVLSLSLSLSLSLFLSLSLSLSVSFSLYLSLSLSRRVGGVCLTLSCWEH